MSKYFKRIAISKYIAIYVAFKKNYIRTKWAVVQSTRHSCILNQLTNHFLHTADDDKHEKKSMCGIIMWSHYCAMQSMATTYRASLHLQVYITIKHEHLKSSFLSTFFFIKTISVSYNQFHIVPRNFSPFFRHLSFSSFKKKQTNTREEDEWCKHFNKHLKYIFNTAYINTHNFS